MKTTRSGWVDTAGIRSLNQSSRCFFTLARRRSVATNVFFVCEPELAKERANGIRMRPNTRGVYQDRRQLGHRDIAILRDEFREKGAVRIEFAFASRAPLKGWEGLTCTPDCKRPTGSCRR